MTKGLGSVYQRSNGVWVAAIDVGGRDGKRIRKTATARTSTEAKAKLKELIARHQAGDLLPSKSTSLADYLKEWLQTSVKPHKAARTYLTYENAVNNYLVPVLGKRRLDSLTGQQIQHALGKLVSEGHTARMVNFAGLTLKVALTRAVKWGLISRNPATGVELPRFTPKETAIFSPEEARAFLELVREHPHGNLYTIILVLALRKGEALALQWSDIDLDAGLLTVNSTLQYVNGKAVRATPKTKRSKRTLHLPSVALEALQRQREHTNSVWVFPTHLGTPLSPARVNHNLNDILRDSDLPRITVHGLRHTASSGLLEAGVPVHVVSEFLGHASVVITLSIYAHVLDQSRRDIAGEIDRLFR